MTYEQTVNPIEFISLARYRYLGKTEWCLYYAGFGLVDVCGMSRTEVSGSPRGFYPTL